ncbi:ABC transporter ATP-binding protein [Metabacillus sp. RGM 3146]|uniref:ABC transporter ATP-binding protein n=1 Tax=Metabacillus sp. RGM 3146 TaxID=3401092 RepID=UPI003B9B7C8B
MSLELQSVTKHYADKPVLRGMNLSIQKGTFLALLGPSGCGKTTLLQTIAGLTSIDQGKILIDGKIVSESGNEVPIEKREIGMVFQDFALWPHMNVFENVSFGLKLRGIKGQELKRRVIETLSIFHMEEYLSRFPHELSGGQKQRIAMARAIALTPRLILMDEPLSALDTALREEMRVELVRIFKQLNMTVIYVTHDQGEAMSMADQIAILKDGKIEQIGAPETLYREPVSEYVAKFMGRANIINKKGNSSSAFIRPDDVRILPANVEGASGKVMVRTYLGSHYRYLVNVQGYIKPIEVAHPDKIEIGTSVNIEIPVEKCRVFRV